LTGLISDTKGAVKEKTKDHAPKIKEHATAILNLFLGLHDI
jgi:hypothetical protein